MRITKANTCVAAVAAALTMGCPAPAPVARLSVEPSNIDLGYPGFVELRMSWEFTAPPQGVEGDLRVFVHLNDETGGQARTFDHVLPFDWSSSTSGDYGINLYQSALAPPLTAGSYDVTVGLYDGAGSRWPLEVEGEEVATSEYRVAGVAVSDASEDYPMFYFSAGWLPVEGGSDRQILGRRWLSEGGTLTVSELAGAGDLLFLVGIPSKNAEGRELVMEEDGGSELSLRIASDCGAFETTLTGTGTHELRMPYGPDESGELPAECAIEFDPNFYLVSMDTLERRSIALESLAWRAGA